LRYHLDIEYEDVIENGQLFEEEEYESTNLDEILKEAL